MGIQQIDFQRAPERAMGNQPPCVNLLRAAVRKEASMRPNTKKNARAMKMLWFHTTRMATVMIIVVINITNVTATPAKRRVLMKAC